MGIATNGPYTQQISFGRHRRGVRGNTAEGWSISLSHPTLQAPLMLFPLSKFEWAKTTGAIIEHFGGFSPRDLLGSENLNSPRNAMLVASFVHILFDNLQLWMTPYKVDLVLRFCTTRSPLYLGCRILTGTSSLSNKYDVNLCRKTWNPSLRHTAAFRSFRTSHGDEIDPPSPEFLALHASCAQVARKSDVVGYLEEKNQAQQESHL